MERAVTAVGVGTLVALAGLAVAQGQDDATDFVHYRSLYLQGPGGDTERVLAAYPRREDGRQSPPNERYPVVVALSGLGESQKGPERGAAGWMVDYRLPFAVGAIGEGRLDATDYRSFVTPEHLAVVNAELRAGRTRGVLVVMPYTPNLMTEPSGSPALARYADWVAGGLLEQIRNELPVAAHGRESTGIDGVSLGGLLALEIGFAHPETFGAVGAIQPAIRGREGPIAEAAAAARTARHHQEIRLLTSSGDPFREPTEQLSRQLRNRRVPHHLLELPGPHDYAFNQGPGALELLRFHGQALAPEPQ